MLKRLSAFSHYDRSACPALRKYQTLSFEEAKSLKVGTHVLFVTRNGRVARAKVNAKVKSWASVPHALVISLKYGMYEHFHATYRDYKPEHEQLVKEIPNHEE